MKGRIEVYKRETLLGFLSVDDYGTLSFKYNEAYLKSVDATAISVSLPLSEQEYYGNAAHSFFVGLLPEERELTAIAQAIGTDPSNEFRLLVELGKETIGGLTIGMPPDNAPSYKKISLEELNARLSSKDKIAPQAYLKDNVRLSLAGAQSKIALLKQGNDFFLPIDGAASNIIIKPQNTAYRNLVENEFLTMRLASLCGIQVPAHYLIDAKGEIAFGVDRFDRITRNNRLERIMQEDFCQALGIMPVNKYEQDGGPGFLQCITLIRTKCHIPARDIPRFIDIFIFNFFIGNRDAHGKNFSLGGSNKPELAPAYDLVCTSYYENLSPKMAMSINGQFEDDLVSLNDWKELALGAHISWRILHNRLVYFRKVIPEQLRKLRIQQDASEEFCESYCEHILQRVNRLSENLWTVKND